ncbi:MAG: 2-hydroxychromene-2-carboxylate isomerase [Myxococcales bacterium]|nr:2-hydroxychromene-2-carboxylate isomerase [Myxococcales bacterium]
MADSPQIEFFYDVVSPYTYLASTRIEALAERLGATLRWRPFLLGAVFKATGNAPPAQVPARGRYLLEDLERWARYYGIPFSFPGSFPARSITAQRALVAAARLGTEADATRLAKAIFHEHWGEGRPIDAPERISSLATGIGLDGAAILQACGEPEIKEALRVATEEAVSRGAFGSPTFFAGERMFFGNDRLELLEHALEGEGVGG